MWKFSSANWKSQRHQGMHAGSDPTRLGEASDTPLFNQMDPSSIDRPGKDVINIENNKYGFLHAAEGSKYT